MSNSVSPFTTTLAEPDTCEGPHAATDRLEGLRGALIPAAVAGTLAETFRALGDPTRVRLLDALSRAELCVCDLAALIGLSESATSHQLRLLRSLRLVRTRRAGRQIFYALDDAHITRLLAQGLEHVEEAQPARRPSEGRDA